ncbi:MAG: hypothetical protein H0V09_08210 [Gemmatimonadetes bacterium]|nr:hypothetical protein [Gemmatimonadota bacterium]
MTLEYRGDDLVLVNFPYDLILPEKYPVTWNAKHRNFSVPRRHSCVPALMRIFRERGLVEEESGMGRQAVRR